MSLQNYLSNISFLTLLVSVVLVWAETLFSSESERVNVKNNNVVLKSKSEKKLNTLISYSTSNEKGVSQNGIYTQHSNFFFLFKKGSVAVYGVWFSNLLLSCCLILRWKESGHFPLSNLYESLMFLSWCFTAFSIYFNWSLRQLKYLSLMQKLVCCVTIPCALLCNAFASLYLPKEMQEASPLVPALQSNWLMMHVSVMILSYSALILGSLMSILFLIVTNSQFSNSSFWNVFKNHAEYKVTAQSSEKNLHLQSEKLAGLNVQRNIREPKQEVQTVPEGRGGGVLLLSINRCVSANTNLKLSDEESKQGSLQSTGEGGVTVVQIKNENKKKGENTLQKIANVLDNLSYRILALGFPLLTIGILSGAVWANEAWGSYWSWDPKETWALLTWLVFAVYLHTRLSKGWEGKKPAVVASFGFFIVWMCYLGVNLIGEGLHSYGWIVKS